MCIEQWSGRYVPTCDLCGDTLEAEYDWRDAKAAMESAGWKRRMIDGIWMDICPECHRMADEE